MTVAARRGRPRDDSKDEAVLHATLEELRDHGTGAMSIERIAARAGVAKTTIYRRWPNSDELATDAVCRLLTDDSPPPDVDGRSQLIFVADRIRKTWSDETYAAIMRRASADGTTHPEVYGVARERLIGPSVRHMNAAIRRCVDEGLIEADTDVELVRVMIVSPVISRAFTLRPPMSKASLVRVIDTVLRGLAP